MSEVPLQNSNPGTLLPHDPGGGVISRGGGEASTSHAHDTPPRVREEAGKCRSACLHDPKCRSFSLFTGSAPRETACVGCAERETTCVGCAEREAVCVGCAERAWEPFSLPGAATGAISRRLPGGGPEDSWGSAVHLTQSFFEDVLHKSIPTQIRQLVLYISHSKG